MTEAHLRDEDRAYIKCRLTPRIYKGAGQVVAAGSRLPEKKHEDLRELIKDGLKYVEAGRVHHSQTGEEFVADIKRMSIERKRQTRTGY